MPDELSQDDIDALLSGAGGELGVADDGGSDLAALLGSAEPMTLDDFGSGSDEPTDPASIDMLYDIELDVKIELGRTYKTIEEILALREGSVVQLEKGAGAPVDILINGRLVAEGEILVLNEYFCVRVTNIFSDRDRSIIKR